MATLGIKRESPSLLVLGKPLTARIGNLVTGLVILGAALYFLSSSLGDLGSGGQGEGLILLLLTYLLWTNLSSGAVGRTVTIDGSARRVTAATDFIGFPFNRTDLPFNQVRRVLVNSRVPVLASQTGARPVWQASIETTDGPLLVVSRNGTHSEMLELGNKIARLIGQPVVDELSQVMNVDETPTVPQPIQDFGGGGMPSYAPPVAAPIPLGRRARPLQPSEKQPPANTLTVDSGRGKQAEAMLPSTLPVTDQPGPIVLPTTSVVGTTAPLDTGQPSMSPMPLMGMADSANQSAMPSMPPLGSGAEMGQTFSMPPMGGFGSGMELGQSSYSPPPLTMPDQPPMSPLAERLSSPQASQPPPATSETKAPASSWVRPRTEDELQQATREDPTDSRAFYETARLWHARGDYNRALDAYLQAIHLDPASAPAQNDLGVLYMQRGKYKEAEAALRRASGLDPFFVIGHYNLGLLLARTRRASEARQALTRGQQSAGNDAERLLFDNALRGVFVPPQMTPV